MPVLRPILFMPPILFLPPRRVGESAARGGGMPAGEWGFCTIRRIATACRRRVAALMLQFPPARRPEWRILAARWPAVGIRRPALRVQRPRCSPPQRITIETDCDR